MSSCDDSLGARFVHPQGVIRIKLSNVMGGAMLDGSTSFDVQVTNDDFATPRPGGGGGAATEVPSAPAC